MGVVYSTKICNNEVEIAALEGHRSGQSPSEKKVWSKILKSAIYELRQKKAENNRHSDLK